MRGRIVMPWLGNAELALDGKSLGPFALSTAADLASASQHDCVLSSVQIYPEPEGLYFYQPKDPSPLQERWRTKEGSDLQTHPSLHTPA